MLVFVGGVFLRTHHFSDWLHFELDQSRDAKVVDLAIEQGIGNLPLLGPKAAGSFLRLGPIFYYFEYLSALLFGNTPDGIAVLGLIFSCLAVALFYLLARRFFDEKISLMASAVFASSYFLVMYSRFAWNPNSLPFFVLLMMYSLLRAADDEEPKKGWWLVLTAIALSIATQLHFIAFLALPVILAVFLAIRRPRIKFLFWIGALSAILIFYLPNIINDFKTGGENINEFAKVFEKKSSDSDYTLPEKAIRGAEEMVLGNFLILSGYSKTELPKVAFSGDSGMQVVCNDKCKDGLPMGLVAILVLALGLALCARGYVAQKDARSRDFVLLTGIWFLVSLGLFVPIAFDMAPRFLLLVAPLPFLFFAFILDFLDKKGMVFIAYALLLLVLGTNIWGVWERFGELGRADQQSFKPGPDRILKEDHRVTLKQQLLITDHIESVWKENKFPVYVNSEPFYRRSFLYHLEQRGILRDDFRNVEKVYQKGNYFLIYPTLSNLEKRTEKYLIDFDIVETKEFGTLKVFQLAPKPESIRAVEQIFGPSKKPTSSLGVPVRCRWNEIFGQCNTDGSEDLSDEGSVESD